MRNGDVYRFGSYELDSGSRLLYRGQEPIALSRRHMTVLLRPKVLPMFPVNSVTYLSGCSVSEFVTD